MMRINLQLAMTALHLSRMEMMIYLEAAARQLMNLKVLSLLLILGTKVLRRAEPSPVPPPTSLPTNPEPKTKKSLK